MTNEPDAFLRTILANPADPLPRLVFADWLEETGARSNIAWAKYLRLSEEVAALPPGDDARGKKSRLLARLGTLIQAKLRYKAEVFVAHSDCLRRVLPLRCMILDVDTVTVSHELADALPASLALEYAVVPLHLDATTLTVAAEEMTAESADTLGFLVNRRVEWVPAPREALHRAVETAYEAVGVEHADCVTFSIPFAPALPLEEAQTPAHRIIELFLSDAREEDVRDIVIRRAGPRIEVRFYRPGTSEYDIWGGFPPAVHLPMVNHFRRLARLPQDGADPEQSGIFRYHFGSRFYDVALRIQPGISGPQIHLTILPYLSEPTIAVNRVA